jgi:hypothetical protein
LRIIGFTASPRFIPACFHAGMRALRLSVPWIINSPGSFFLAASPLQSPFALHSVQWTFRSSARPTWVLALSRSWGSRPPVRRFPTLRYVPSPGFLNLSTVFSVLPCRGLVSSRYHVQDIACSGASLTVQPPFLIGRSIPPCRCHQPARRLAPAATRPAPRLRGLSPHGAAFPLPGSEPHNGPLPSPASFSSRSPFSHRRPRLTQDQSTREVRFLFSVLSARILPCSRFWPSSTRSDQTGLT